MHSRIVFLFLVLTCNLTAQTQQDLLQAIMDSGKLSTFVDTTSTGELAPVVFITNNLIGDQIVPQYKQTSVIVSDHQEIELPDYHRIEIIKAKNKPNKSDLTLHSERDIIRFKFKWRDDQWVMTSFKLKGKKRFLLDKEF